jgi:hypothetical protein
MNWTRDIGWVFLLFVVVAWIGGLLIGDDVDAPAIRKCADKTLPPALVDVLSRLPAADAEAARAGDGCLITWAHEATHFVNSRHSDGKQRGFYLLDGVAWKVPLPRNTRLAHVADAIPAKHRGKTYKTYLIEAQRDWQDIAIYPLDEAVAYTSGCITRRELGWERRQETDRFCIELLVYSKYAVDEVCRREGSEYPKDDLRALLELMVARARLAIEDFDKQPYADALAGIGESLLAEVADAEESE